MIGKKPLTIPQGVTVTAEDRGGKSVAKVAGPKGNLEVVLPRGLGLDVKEDKLSITKTPATHPSIFGLGFALVRNAVEGVSEGFTTRLELVGVGYRVSKAADGLKLTLGFSHPVEFKLPEGVEAEVKDDTKITLSGIDKNLVTRVAANIRKLRPPEPYKGKGIRYEGEVVRKKLGKAAKAAAA